MRLAFGAAALLGAILWAAPGPESFRFVILGDRTGEPEPGIYEKVWQAAAAEKPAFVLSVGDTIQGMNEAKAEAEWKEVERTLALYRQIAVYLTPGNHDIWSEASEKLFVKYAAHPVHYGFDYGPAHFTVLDNSRTDQLSAGEMAFLEEDLKAHAAQPFKFIVSHRPSWILNALLRNPNFPLHQLAKKYGVQYVIAGHVHEMLHYDLEGIEYVSMVSSGGHLRASGKYEDGWFFGYAAVEVRKSEAIFEIHEVAGEPTGRVTQLRDWGAAGLIRQ